MTYLFKPTLSSLLCSFYFWLMVVFIVTLYCNCLGVYFLAFFFVIFLSFFLVHFEEILFWIRFRSFFEFKSVNFFRFLFFSCVRAEEV